MVPLAAGLALRHVGPAGRRFPVLGHRSTFQHRYRVARAQSTCRPTPVYYVSCQPPPPPPASVRVDLGAQPWTLSHAVGVLLAAAIFLLGLSILWLTRALAPFLKVAEGAMREMETAAKSMESCSEEVEKMAEMFQADMPPALEALEDASREAEELVESVKVLLSPLTSINGGPAVKRKQGMRAFEAAAGGAGDGRSGFGDAELATSDGRADRAQSLQLAVTMQELFPSWGKVDATSLISTVNLLINDWKARVDLLSTKIARSGQPASLLAVTPDAAPPRYQASAAEAGDPSLSAIAGFERAADGTAVDPALEAATETDQLRERASAAAPSSAAGASAAADTAAVASASVAAQPRRQAVVREPSSVQFCFDDDISDSFLDWEYRLRLDTSEACDEDDGRDAGGPGALSASQASGGAEMARPRVSLTARVSRLLFSREAAADNIAETSDGDELYDSDDDGASVDFFDSSFDPGLAKRQAQKTVAADGAVPARSHSA